MAKHETAQAGQWLTARQIRETIQIGADKFRAWVHAGIIPPPGLIEGQVRRWPPGTIEAIRANLARRAGHVTGQTDAEATEAAVARIEADSSRARRRRPGRGDPSQWE